MKTTLEIHWRQGSFSCSVFVLFSLSKISSGEECYISSQRRFNRMVWTIPRQGLTSCTSLMLGGYQRSRTFSDDVIKVNKTIITIDPAQVQRFLQNNGKHNVQILAPSSKH